MSQIIKRVISLGLAILIGFTSVGFSADLHFCKGHFKSMALFGAAKSCHKMKTNPSCHSTNKVIDDSEKSCDLEKDDNCCKNERVSRKMDYDAPIVLQGLDNQGVEDVAPIIISLSLFIAVTEDVYSLSQSHPPDINNHNTLYGNEMRIAFQSFLC